MEKDLKKENSPQLTVILLATFFMVIASHLGMEWAFQKAIDKAEALKNLGMFAVATAMSGILANLLPAGVKHFLVFIGHRHALPGHRCPEICARDPRIPFGEAERKWPALFSSETEQKDKNALWYQKVYKPVRDLESVRNSHRNFLLFRDAFSSTILLFVLAVVLYFTKYSVFGIAVSYTTILVLGLESVITLIAARNSGNRMVVNAVSNALDMN